MLISSASRSIGNTGFEPGLPLYLQVSKDGCVLQLSEHHGDCSPGAAMRIETSELDAFHAELASKHRRPWRQSRSGSLAAQETRDSARLIVKPLDRQEKIRETTWGLRRKSR